MKIQLSEDAIRDLASGADFYESIKEGLGIYFNDCLASDIDSLLLYAGVHASDEGLFYTMSQRFPYVIWYGVNDQTIVVYAVLDARAAPDENRQRIQDRRQ